MGSRSSATRSARLVPWSSPRSSPRPRSCRSPTPAAPSPLRWPRRGRVRARALRRITGVGPCYGWPMGRGVRRVVLAMMLALVLGCAVRRPHADVGRAPFRFPDDTFAFANSTIWEYEIDASTSHVAWHRREPPPAFSLRCGTIARAVRQFYAGARFDPSAAIADDATYERLVRQVLRTDPRRRP